jgi:hypothetical protein
MTAFSNLRQDPFSLVYSDRVMDPEIYTVAELPFLPGTFGIVIQDRPAPTTVVITENVTGGITYAEVTTTPAANQYRVNYARGVIIFNPTNAGDSVEVNYSGRGTNLTYEILQDLIAQLAGTFEFINATDTNGVTIRSQSLTNVATFGAGDTANATFAGTVGITGATTLTGGALLPDGSVGTPGLRWLNSLAMGFYRVASNILGVSINGSKVGEFNSNGWQGLDNRIIFVDSKGDGVSGGTATSGSYNTRDITALIVNRIAGSSLSSNQITLPAGTYLWDSEHTAYNVNGHQAKLRNITASTDLIIGSTEWSNNGSASTTKSRIKDQFTLAVSSIVEVQHRPQSTIATNGFGIAAAFTVTENIYSQGEIIKIA